jgi:Tol biopolymer transport system component
MDTSGVYQDHSPSLDETGGLIAFVSTRRGDPDVLVYDAAGKSLLALPDLAGPASDVDPWITPEGRHLAFASDRAGGSGGYDLYLYDLQARAFVALDPEVNTAATERRPALDPDASRIVFESDRTGTQGDRDLWIHVRTPAATTRAGASGPGTDIQPYLVWR